MTDRTTPPDWLDANRATWDERVGLHLKSDAYDLAPLREGRAVLHPIEEAEIGDVAGLRIAHLQCHFGRDTLTLAQKGAARVVGLDLSGEAIRVARELAGELGLADRATFVEADLYSAPEALAEDGPFDMVFVTWGAIGWLPDLDRWARIVAELLRPGGRLYLAEGHPAAMVFDTDAGEAADEKPAWRYPYMDFGLQKEEAPKDYTGDFPDLEAGHEYWWDHPLSEILSAVASAGLRLDWFHEHDQVPWPMFSFLAPAPGAMYRWPDRRWLPLAFSLQASK
ncbi:bifunctional 2-polyprenyl-6-hydroxyphenol methylase/3-demethylubiquinol 3-O-methyltransferase UbiG [Pseudoruegeria sp. HB172150]|uniref:class I SAM-dependent methyltransferase n=1 Tax=Pseudoruegeria sp. HB172150 TaxID=2721164 RepID=UPI001C131DEA|nr:class I SAM-dependent methyltransferase [Pseudoruegeria sp. HB172150]